jgi:hypothetical protein
VSFAIFFLRDKVCSNILILFSGAYILESNSPPPRGGIISANVICGKNMKRRREKGGKCKRKKKKGERKGRKGKENEKREVKG